MVLLPRLRWLAVGAATGGVACLGVPGGAEPPAWDLPGEAKVLTASADDRWLATSDAARRVSVWSTADRRRVAGPLERARDPRGLPAAAFSGNGRWLAVGGESGFVYLHSLPDSRSGSATIPAAGATNLWAVQGHRSVILDLAFAPDDGAVLAASGDARISVWSVPGGRPEGYLTGHKDQVWALAFSPDGKALATGSRDNGVRLWEWPSRRLRAELGGHASRVRKLAFTPDGRTLLSGSDDETVRFWHLPTGREVAAIRMRGGLASMALAAGSEGLFTLEGSGGVRWWPAPDRSRVFFPELGNAATEKP